MLVMKTKLEGLFSWKTLSLRARTSSLMAVSVSPVGTERDVPPAHNKVTVTSSSSVAVQPTPLAPVGSVGPCSPSAPVLPSLPSLPSASGGPAGPSAPRIPVAVSRTYRLNLGLHALLLKTTLETLFFLLTHRRRSEKQR